MESLSFYYHDRSLVKKRTRDTREDKTTLSFNDIVKKLNKDVNDILIMMRKWHEVVDMSS
jgi:hypothetical protein